jgi:hypothetical protein
MRTAVLVIVLGTAIGSQVPDAPAVITIPARFDRDISGDRLIVPVTVNDRVFPCHLDSGGGAILAIDRDAVERAGLGATRSGSSAGAGTTATPDRRVDGARIRVADVSVPNATVILRPFEPEAPETICIFGSNVKAGRAGAES